MIDKLKDYLRESVFVRRAATVFVINVLGVLLAFLAHVVLARVLGVRGFGYYIYALTLVSLLSLFAMLGLNTSIVKLLASYESQQNWPLFRSIVRFAAKSAAIAHEKDWSDFLRVSVFQVIPPPRSSRRNQRSPLEKTRCRSFSIQVRTR